jgi:homoserine kinase type II
MAVYTPITDKDLEVFLYDYNIPPLKGYAGIEEGVSNTNYLLQMKDKSKYILTLFEPRRVHEKDLPVFLAYSKHLNKHSIPTPEVIPTCDGDIYNYLNNRPAAVFSFLEGIGGHKLKKITPETCYIVGELNARMHMAAESFECNKLNAFGTRKWDDWIYQLGNKLDSIQIGLHDFVRAEYQALINKWPSNLPKGAIHADLFPDNVFFEKSLFGIKNNISGIIDFHFVCNDFFVYDLAITINAWCFDAHNRFSDIMYNRLLEGYESIRPLSEKEYAALPILLRGVALRFLLSRAEEYINHKAEEIMVPKDPLQFYQRLCFFQDFMSEPMISFNEEDDDDEHNPYS